jgi:tRNA nucleotidyltransferase/poly(A) polymerase
MFDRKTMPSYPTRLLQPFPPSTATAVQPKTVYIVGGSVRDLLLGRSPLDYDLAVAVDPKRFAGRLAAHTNGRLVELGKPGQMLYRVVTSSNVFDVSGLTGPTIEADLSHRDFTINAMAVDAATGEIIDVFNGREDLRAGRVHMVSETVFRQDPVRLVRAFRMAAVYDFQVSAQTAAAVQTHAALIAKSAGERVWSELLKTLETRRSDCSVRQMAACGLLQAILPEMASKCPRTTASRHQDAVDRTIEAYSELEKLLLDSSSIIPDTLNPDARLKTAIPAALLKFALLLQGFVKLSPATSMPQRSPRTGPANDICRRLKMSNRQAHDIDFIIRHHKKPHALYTAYRRKRLSDTAVTRLFMSSGDKLAGLLLNAAAVVSAATGKTDDHGERFSKFARDLLKRYTIDFKPRSAAPPLLNGQDLIACFNLAPSPAFKFLLDRIEIDRLAGRIHSRNEALERIGRLLQGGRRDT